MSVVKSAARGVIADKIKESMREALDTVRTHKMRSGLVILGVMIGLVSASLNCDRTISGFA